LTNAVYALPRNVTSSIICTGRPLIPTVTDWRVAVRAREARADRPLKRHGSRGEDAVRRPGQHRQFLESGGSGESPPRLVRRDDGQT
jgi:hypothetical protein